jgi:hypothetical protein
MVVAVAVPVIAPGPLEGRLPTCELRARVRRVHGGVACCQPAAASGRGTLAGGHLRTVASVPSHPALS